MVASNTGQKQGNNGRFTKGDPRINRKGRPRSFDKLRDLAQQIFHEASEAALKEGHGWTRLEVLLRSWISSGDFRKQQAALEVAFGKVPDEMRIEWRREAEKAGVDASEVFERYVQWFAASMAGRDGSGSVDGGEAADGDKDTGGQ